MLNVTWSLLTANGTAVLPAQSAPLTLHEFAVPVDLDDGTAYIVRLEVCNYAGLCAASDSTPFIPDTTPPYSSPIYDIAPGDDWFMLAVREAYTGFGMDPLTVGTCANSTLAANPGMSDVAALLQCIPPGVNSSTPLLSSDADGSWEAATSFALSATSWWANLASECGDPCALNYWATSVSTPMLSLHVRWALGDPVSHIDHLVVAVGSYWGGSDVLSGVTVPASAAVPPQPGTPDTAAFEALGPGVYALQRFRQYWDAYVVVPTGPTLTWWKYLHVTVFGALI